MSFLASLRQQTPANSTMQIFYVVMFLPRKIYPCEYNIDIQCRLGHMRNQRPEHNHTLYTIQRDHLNTPPAFINAADKAVMQALLNCDAHSEGIYRLNGLEPAYLDQVLSDIIQTGRGYFSFRQHALILHQPLMSKATITLPLQWHIQRDGSFLLGWKNIPSQHVVLALHNSCAHHKTNTPFAYLWHPESQALQRIHNQAMPPSPPEKKDTETQYIQATPKAALYCDSTPENHQACLEYRYETPHYCFSCPAKSTIEKLDNEHKRYDGSRYIVIQRDFDAEAVLYRDIETLFSELPVNALEMHHAMWSINHETDWKTLLLKQQHRFEQKHIFFTFSPHFKYPYVSPKKWNISLQELDDGIIQFCLDLHIDQRRVSLKDIIAQLETLGHIQHGDDTFIQLQNGQLLLLPKEKILSLKDEFGDIEFSSDGDAKLVRNQLSRLGHLHSIDDDDIHWEGDTTLYDAAINIHKSPVVLNADMDFVQATLRPYQWLGVCWLQHLTQHNANGLLADDMGLGKTLQTIAFLSFLHQQKQLTGPALIVVPTSLMHNWKNEISQFSPTLNCIIFHGAKRQALWRKLADYDVIITSYGLISTDLDLWQQQTLSWVILDEAQAIKNPTTRTSQSIKSLPCDKRLCLSGTPVENHLGELWSLFDFLLPGLLGTQKHFQQHFRTPIENQGNTQQMQFLLNRIAPFILRRTKDQVATDLPPKTVTNQIVTFEHKQAEFYDDIKSLTWADLQDTLQGDDDTPENVGKNHILLLTALMKLRQACCDPELLGETGIPSAKREHCLHMVEELVEEKRSILIFSQFTSMLDILARELEARDIHYAMLTGKTSHRERVVEEFQSGNASVFLMSLKAGGVGLNLTRADTVIHYDPWWNSAAEQQATDRAHRIGQDKPVFVYKLVTQNTIEEKITKMQEQKLQLSQHIHQQAQQIGDEFALSFKELLSLWEDDQTGTPI